MSEHLVFFKLCSSMFFFFPSLISKLLFSCWELNQAGFLPGLIPRLPLVWPVHSVLVWPKYMSVCCEATVLGLKIIQSARDCRVIWSLQRAQDFRLCELQTMGSIFSPFFSLFFFFFLFLFTSPGILNKCRTSAKYCIKMYFGVMVYVWMAASPCVLK